ncbi:hypothetical protein WA026_007435 [Henosepilachna vigintioctopunctata]|uniref:Sulfotransferase domain-containing protein n=1 Tax=Henosepilachna vigintioctopunctata TaxID=420089 RepID=A0AAW1UU50_9CUCU
MSNHEFPFEIRDIDPIINKELLQDFRGERTGFIQVGEKKWCFPVKFKDHLPSFYNFKVRPDDVWIVTFPRSGTTLTQEMVWLLANNLDYGRALSVPLVSRFPFLEAFCLFHPEVHAEFLAENRENEEKYKSVEKLSESICTHLDEMEGRRFIKTHLPLTLLPKNLLTAGCKVLYIARNPKDLAVSHYHHTRLIRVRDFRNDFPKFWNYFSNNLINWAPYWEHVLEAWEKRNEENLLFLFYESINENVRKTISEVQNFLGVNFTDEQLSTLNEHLKIDNFRKNKSVNFNAWSTLGIFNENEEPFIRKGKSGDAKKYFDEELEKKANEWIEERLKSTDMKFPNFQ